VRSARLFHLDVAAYLTDILRRLPAMLPTDTALIRDLLPNRGAEIDSLLDTLLPRPAVARREFEECDQRGDYLISEFLAYAFPWARLVDTEYIDTIYCRSWVNAPSSSMAPVEFPETVHRTVPERDPREEAEELYVSSCTRTLFTHRPANEQISSGTLGMVCWGQVELWKAFCDLMGFRVVTHDSEAARKHPTAVLPRGRVMHAAIKRRLLS
jgi:hypothetical protein